MTSETFNIVNLIEKNSITRLSKEYESKLVNKIKTSFTNNDQQIFLSSFYCYLKYDSTKDFVIDFDNVWKWVGFTRKSNAKRLLEKHFTKDTDYEIKTILLPLEENKNITESRGRKEEQIILTVNTFKKFCLKANTKKADEIHDYYIKLETVLQETIDEQTSELRNQLTNKDKEIKTVKTKLLSKHKEIATIEEENINLKKKMRERQRHRYTEGSSVYIIMNNDIKDKFKFGETKNVNKRLTQLNSGAPSQYYVHKMWHTRMAKKTERMVHDIFGKYRISKDCEWFENKTLDKVIEFVDKIVSLYEEYDTVKVIKKAETVQYAPLIFIDTNEKQCTECKLYQPLTSFFIQDNSVEELSKYDSEEHKQKIYSKRYRSKCKNCCSAYAKQHRKELRANPTAGKNECVSCKELLDYKSFFEGFEECISCYKKNRDLDGYYKQCNKCKDILPSSGFHSDINKEDKLHTMCKKCRNDIQKSNKNSDIVICEFCEKEVVGKFNLKSHQKTISCLQKQGLDVVKKVNKSKCRKIIQFSKDGLKIIKQYDSIIQAANDNEICRTAISKCLRGELKTAADFVWKYV